MQKGKSNRKLPNMSGLGQAHTDDAPPRYTPPPRHECSIVEFPVEINAQLESFSRIWVYKGRVVDFAVMLFSVEHGDRVQVARIDTSHGEVHRHRLTVGQGTVGERVHIATIPVEGGWDFVDQQYSAASAYISTQAEQLYRRWKQ